MKNHITPASRRVELKNLLIHPQSRGKAYVLVEGESDVKLFRKLLPKASVKSTGGNTFLESFLAELSKEYRNVIGIRDADFKHLNGQASPLPVLFLTDEHDMEMMLMASDEALGSVCHEYLEGDCSAIDGFRKSVLESIQFLAYLRWFNELNSAELNFSELGLGKFFDAAGRTMDEAKCVEEVLERSPNKKVPPSEDLREAVNALRDSAHSLLVLCQGHDSCSALAMVFSSQGKGVKREDVESHLRTAYTFQSFTKTRLYEDLKSWNVASPSRLWA